MDWYKYDPTNIKNPILKRFRAADKVRILELVALSCSWGNVGVIRLYDDEIAGELNLSLSDWMARRDRYMLHGIFRQIETSSGRHVYEIAPWLLPQQQSDQRQPDCFRAESWDDPEMPEDTISDIREPQTPAPGAMTATERKALFDARKRARKAGEALPDPQLFLLEYRERKARKEMAAVAGPSLFDGENGNGNVAFSGNGASNVTSLQTTEERESEERESEERDNNRGERDVAGNGNEVTGVTVTVPGEEDVVVVAPLADAFSESLEQPVIQRADLIALFADWGVGAEDANAVLAVADSEECRRQMLWMPYRIRAAQEAGKPILNTGGFLIDCIRSRRGIPTAYREAMAKDREQAERKAQAHVAAQKRQREEQAEKAQGDRILRFKQALSEERRSALNQEVFQLLERENSVLHQKWRKARAAGNAPGLLVENALKSLEIRILAEWMQQEAQDGPTTDGNAPPE